MPAAAPMSSHWQGCGDLGHVGSIINGNHSIKDASIHSGLNPTWCLLSWQKEPNGKLGECVDTRERARQEANNAFGKCPQPRGS